METLLDERKIKRIFKEALVEALEERKDMLRDLLAEIMEDVALARAIREGEESERVPRRDVLRLLER